MVERKWIDTPGLDDLLDRAVPDLAETLAADDFYQPVLLLGPTGTGKSYTSLQRPSHISFRGHFQPPPSLGAVRNT